MNEKRVVVITNNQRRHYHPWVLHQNRLERIRIVQSSNPLRFGSSLFLHFLMVCRKIRALKLSQLDLFINLLLLLSCQLILKIFTLKSLCENNIAHGVWVTFK